MSIEIAAVYADGGVIQKNPSSIGGTWAHCFVNRTGIRIAERSGIVLASDIPGGLVTNNLTEFYAVAYALQALPNGWSGTLYSDSQITLGRFFWGWKITGIPLDFVSFAMKAKARLGVVTGVLLDGHPTQAQLAAGIGKRGNPCSKHNVWCDKACGAQAVKYLQNHNVAVAQ